MERFNYPNLAAVYDEDAEILRLLDLESFGDRADQIEEANQMQSRVNTMEGGYQ